MKIAFAGAFAGQLAEPVRARLTVPCEVVTGDETQILGHLDNADVLVSMGFTKAMASAGPRLRLIQVPGAGLDRIDRGALRPGMQLANAYGHGPGIAEYVIGAMIMLMRSFARLDCKLRAGEWESQWVVGAPAPPPWPELAGKMLGILGFGHIGQALAHRARAFDMEVCAIKRQPQTAASRHGSLVAGPEQLDVVLRQSDFVAITLPLTPQTRGLLDERRLSLMRPTAFLINVARAEIIDEVALYRALASRSIAGAALDVWYRYPARPGPTLPSAQPFHKLANVIMTPHVSGWTEGMLEARAKLIAENIERTARGGPPLNAIAHVSENGAAGNSLG